VSGAGLTLRPAAAADARLVWAWRNDPVSRAASRDTAEIAWESHARWFPEALKSRRMLIGEAGGAAVGLVRFDPGPDGVHRVSINLAPEARGRGLGGRLLAAACATVDGPLAAEIREDNVASERIFLACGFRKLGQEGAFGLYRRD
jgi:L-amino acid N-acyltransferase YncA